MQLEETQDSVRRFFEGCSIERNGVKIFCPGWTWAMDQPCDLRDEDNIQFYKNNLDRVGSVDEVMIAGCSQEYGCAPTGARRAFRASLKTSSNITAIEGVTFDGTRLAAHYIVQGCSLPSGHFPKRGRVILRPDGYFITDDIFVKYLHSLAETIPGARRDSRACLNPTDSLRKKHLSKAAPLIFLQAECRPRSASCL